MGCRCDGESLAVARPHVATAAHFAAKRTESWSWWLKDDRSERVQALAKAFEKGAPDAAATLEAFIAELETERKAPNEAGTFPPTDP